MKAIICARCDKVLCKNDGKTHRFNVYREVLESGGLLEKITDVMFCEECILFRILPREESSKILKKKKVKKGKK